MKTIQLTDAELKVLKQAVEVFNDMQNDVALDSLEFNLFPRGDEVTTITSANASEIRKSLNDKMSELCNIRAVMVKIGSKVNDAGYTV